MLALKEFGELELVELHHADHLGSNLEKKLKVFCILQLAVIGVEEVDATLRNLFKILFVEIG